MVLLRKQLCGKKTKTQQLSGNGRYLVIWKRTLWRSSALHLRLMVHQAKRFITA